MLGFSYHVSWSEMEFPIYLCGNSGDDSEGHACGFDGNSFLSSCNDCSESPVGPFVFTTTQITSISFSSHFRVYSTVLM